MQRRAFIGQLAAGAAAGFTGPGLAGELGATLKPMASPNSNLDWTLGYRSIDQLSYEAEVSLRGQWPAALSGAFYRNGPAQHDVGTYRYTHWFDGDGLVQRFQASGGQLQHRALPVATAKRQREQALGRAALPAFGSVPPNGVGVSDADDMNPANISLLAHHDRLYALWEAGSPYQIDPHSLQTRGPKAFTKDTAGLPFSAHPRVEPDGTLWNFGYASGAGKIVLWHIAADGVLKQVGALDVGATGMPHDFIVTDHYLVLLISPLHRTADPQGSAEAEADSASFLDLHRWHPEQPTRVLVVDKNTLTLTRELELPAQWIFHFGNGFEESNGIIHFDAARSANPEILLNTFRTVMNGAWHRPPNTRWTHYQLDLKAGTATESAALDAGLSVEFPRIDARQSGRAHDAVWLLSGHEAQNQPGGLNQVSRYERTTDRLDSFRFAEHYLVEEHLFIADRARAKAGWLLGTALNLRTQQTELNLFNAYQLHEGPIASASLPYAMPLGFHGTYSNAFSSS